MSVMQNHFLQCVIEPLAVGPAQTRVFVVANAIGESFPCLPSGAGARRLGTVCGGHKTQEFVSAPRRGGYRFYTAEYSREDCSAVPLEAGEHPQSRVCFRPPKVSGLLLWRSYSPPLN